MRTLFLLPALLLVGSLAALILQAHATPDPLASTPPRTIVVGIDLSSSNPLVHDDAFAANVAARVSGDPAGESDIVPVSGDALTADATAKAYARLREFLRTKWEGGKQW